MPSRNMVPAEFDETVWDMRRVRWILTLAGGLLGPFVVLLLPAGAQPVVRAGYALCLALVVIGGGFWVTFRARTHELVNGGTPRAVTPAWAVVMRACGLLVMAAGCYLTSNTGQDVAELISGGHPKTFVEAPRAVEGRAILHPIFQTARLRGDGRYAQVYMFAYGGKRLERGTRYVLTVLPRSHWILSAREETATASR